MTANIETRPVRLPNDCPPQQRRRAARYIASHAGDAEQCAELLAMLGLTARDGLDQDE